MSQLVRYSMGPMRKGRCRFCGCALLIDEDRWALVSLPLYMLVLYCVVASQIVTDSYLWIPGVIVAGFILSLLLTRFVPLRVEDRDQESANQ